MLKNQLLAAAQEKVLETVTDRALFDKIVGALQRTMYDEKIFPQLSDGLRDSKDPLGEAADGIVGLLGAIGQKVRGTMPQEPALQAGFFMFLDALDAMESVGLVQVDAPMLDDATKKFVEAVLPKTGLTPEKLGGALSELQEVFSDPQRVAAYQAAQKGA